MLDSWIGPFGRLKHSLVQIFSYVPPSFSGALILPTEEWYLALTLTLDQFGMVKDQFVSGQHESRQCDVF